jgi:hypothetical protein
MPTSSSERSELGLGCGFAPEYPVYNYLRGLRPLPHMLETDFSNLRLMEPWASLVRLSPAGSRVFLCKRTEVAAF